MYLPSSLQYKCKRTSNCLFKWSLAWNSSPTLAVMWKVCIWSSTYVCSHSGWGNVCESWPWPQVLFDDTYKLFDNHMGVWFFFEFHACNLSGTLYKDSWFNAAIRVDLIQLGIYALHWMQFCSIDPLYIEDPFDFENNVGSTCFRIQQIVKVQQPLLLHFLIQISCCSIDKSFECWLCYEVFSVGDNKV
jgi:hypothetical protein